MNSATARRLLQINRRFYEERGRDFSDTRGRIQPGVLRVLESVELNASILDLGCGNGKFAEELSRRGHQGSYLGLDSSQQLLESARARTYAFPARFASVDLTQLDLTPAPALMESPDLRRASNARHAWSVVTAFAFLHHVPRDELRLQLMNRARQWVRDDGRLILSAWQFSENPRMKDRLVPWVQAGLTSADVDEGDHLVDWRRGGAGIRYVHEFSESELGRLAAAAGFRVAETFRSDGADHRSGLYQTWRPV